MKNSFLNLELKENVLLACLPHKTTVTSWAPFNGGIQKTDSLFNLGLDKNTPCTAIFENKVFDQIIAENNLSSNAVGFMTAADVAQYQECFLEEGAFWVHAMATVGLSNARAIGDPAESTRPEDSVPGTINLWVACNALPEISGQLEAIEIAAAAKTTALFEAGIQSPKTGKPAAGTGTDTIAIIATGEISRNYCGMHTLLGELIGKAVKTVVSKGCLLAKPFIDISK